MEYNGKDHKIYSSISERISNGSPEPDLYRRPVAYRLTPKQAAEVLNILKGLMEYSKRSC